MKRRNIKNNRGSGGPSWDVSHLPPLDGKETGALVSFLSHYCNNTKCSIPEGVDSSLLWEYVLRHGMGGIVGHLAMKNLIDDEYLSERGWECYLQNIYMHKQCIDACAAIGGAAKKTGIPVGLMKGPAIIHQAYDDPGLRSYSDIDIFVRSRGDAVRLVEALGISPMVKSRSSIHRFSDAVKIDAMLGNWMIEISYPLENSSDPSYDLLGRHMSKIAVLSDDPARICDPDPDVHFIYLILHMGVNHFFSRLIWFLDISQLYRAKKESLDFDFIRREFDQLQLAGFAATAADFCRKYISDDMPDLSTGGRGINFRFVKNLTDPRVMAARRYTLNTRGSLANVYPYLSIILKFFLFADPSRGIRLRSNASRWTTRRFLNSFGIAGRRLAPALEPVITVLFVPLSKIFSAFTLRVLCKIIWR